MSILKKRPRDFTRTFIQNIETSFRQLEYTVGLNNFHPKKPEFIQQEIWAKLLTYTITEALTSRVILEKRGTKHEYRVNFMAEVPICRVSLRPTTKGKPVDVMVMLRKEWILIRKERKQFCLQDSLTPPFSHISLT